MMTVRFPTGVSLTYNDAQYLRHGDGTWGIFTGDPDTGGRSIAFIQASAGVVVDWMPPCRIENPAEHRTDEQLFEALARDPRRLRNASGRQLARLKRALADFDARTGSWR